MLAGCWRGEHNPTQPAAPPLAILRRGAPPIHVFFPFFPKVLAAKSHSGKGRCSGGGVWPPTCLTSLPHFTHFPPYFTGTSRPRGYFRHSTHSHWRLKGHHSPKNAGIGENVRGFSQCLPAITASRLLYPSAPQACQPFLILPYLPLISPPYAHISPDYDVVNGCLSLFIVFCCV